MLDYIENYARADLIPLYKNELIAVKILILGTGFEITWAVIFWGLLGSKLWFKFL